MSALQRMRLLDAAFAVSDEQGYQGVTVRRICARAGIASKTFYELFSGSEECFLAAFNYGVDELADIVVPAYHAEGEWAAAIRAALAALLSFLDEEPALRRLVFVDALAGRPRVLARRTEVLTALQTALDRGRAGIKQGTELPPLTSEGVVGAAFGVIYTRLIEARTDSLIALLNPLMSMIVLPYRGHSEAARELQQPVPDVASRASGLRARRLLVGVEDLSKPTDFRLTVRTQLVLGAIAELATGEGGPSNREVADAAGIADQGQISRLLTRLGGLDLVKNVGVRKGARKVWSITPRGEEVLRLGLLGEESTAASRPFDPERAQRAGEQERSSNLALVTAPVNGIADRANEAFDRHGRGSAARSRRGRAPGFRLTPRTRLVLTAVAELSGRNSHPSNREIANAAGVKDQGQISKLLARLQNNGLLNNTGGQTAGSPNAWQITPRGEEILRRDRPERHQAKTKRAK